MASTSDENINLDNLEQAIKTKNNKEILNAIETVTSNKDSLIQDISLLHILLTHENIEILTNTSKLIAELAKTLPNRNKLSEDDLILKILPLITKDNLNCQIQSCRALGNLCYESDAVRNVLYENGALEKIIELLNNGCKLCNTENSSNGNERNIKDNCKILLKVACGLLFNFLVSNDDIQRKALELNTLQTVEEILQIEVKNIENSEDCITHLLLILSLILDNGGEVWITENISESLIEILKNSVNPDISELCLEILHGQAENDDIKTFLAKHGLCELMYNLLEKHKELVNDEDSRALMKMVCDLIVLVLTGDESMIYLYGKGTGEVYKNMISWLQSNDDDLLTTGVLAVGNFARKDVNCIQMVQDGVAKTLLNILSKHNTPNDDLKLQHAVLSALRNLAIPQQNKKILINEGLVDVINPLLEIEQMPVIFKLLGTLRMIIDGQEETAVYFASKRNFIERIVHWCYSTDHLGVKGESSRLLAWLIKNCRSEEAYTNILNVPDTIKCLVDMIPSQHPVMQIEALLSLNLLVLNYMNQIQRRTVDRSDNLQNDKHLELSIDLVLTQANLGPNIIDLIKKCNNSLEKEVVENLLTLIDQVIAFDNIKAHFNQNQLSVELKKLTDIEKLSYLCDKIDNLTLRIDSG